MNNFSIIIPAYNEEKTIGKVVKEACQTKADEIIVVDDASRDNTSQIVLNLQKTDKRIILVRNKLNKGPGGSRKIGLLKSTKDIVLFFDADIKNVNKIMFEKLVFPIIRNKADLVMAAFDNFGRITEFFARPLLRYFFPELSKLKQPLSGLFAIKRNFVFPHLFGRGHRILGDVLLPAYFSGARIREVNIGEIKHKKRSSQEKTDQAFSECQAFFRFLVKIKDDQEYFPLKNSLPLKWTEFVKDS